MRALKSALAKSRESAFAPVDIASLVFFRIAFGLLIFWQVCSHCAHNRIATYWLEPRFLFKFYGFSWVHPWPGHWLYVHWAVVGLFALFIAAGFLYRVSAVLFFLSYTYFFLLDHALYVNHTYLVCLFSFLLIFLPAHRALSVDAWLNPKRRSQTTPAWTLWLLRAQMGIVYFYGGLAKLSPDWLQGEPMRTEMARNSDVPILGRFFREEWAVYAMSYGGLLFDLLIVPFLLWRRTRVAAFCVALVFHLVNARWFSIDVFPWLAISATALFLPPSWPRGILSVFGVVSRQISVRDWKPPPRRRQMLVLSLVAIYLAIQLLVPLHHFLYRGGIEWTFADHLFSWRMMVVKQEAGGFFYVTDPNIDQTFQVNPRQFLTTRQRLVMAYLPDMCLQFAHYLAITLPRAGPKPLQVRAQVFTSINGRRPELLIDPNVDLASEPRTLGRPRWLLSIREPLPPRQRSSKHAVLPRSDRN
jgi:vitamin K-dependent gamma-carboxylase